MVLGSYRPTALQKVAEMHDTSNSWLESEWTGTGVGSTDHRFPFHRSARGTTGELVGSPVGVNCPTAMQAVVELQDSADSM